MKRLWLVAAAVCCAAGMGWAGDKLGTVDLTRLVKQHPDARDAETTMKKYLDEFEKEQKQWMNDLEKLKTEFDKVREEARNKALSDEAREKKQKAAEEIAGRLRELEQKARESVMTRQRQISDQQRRLREGIVAKVQKVIKEYADANGFTLVLNSGGQGSGGESVVYQAASVDITDAILKRIGGDEKDSKTKE